MPAYIALLVDIHDHDGFSEYARAAAPTYAKYGGRIELRFVSVLGKLGKPRGQLAIAGDRTIAAPFLG